MIWLQQAQRPVPRSRDWRPMARPVVLLRCRGDSSQGRAQLPTSLHSKEGRGEGLLELFLFPLLFPLL